MAIDDRVMIDFADWVFEVLDSGADVTNASAHKKLGMLIMKYQIGTENPRNFASTEDDDGDDIFSG